MSRPAEGFKIVRVSLAVYAEIAKRGVFGETVDDVLRRVFELPEDTHRPRYDRRANGKSTRTTRGNGVQPPQGD